MPLSRALLLFATAITTLLAFPSAFLLFTAETASARLVALSGLALALVPPLALRRLEARGPRWPPLAAASAVGLGLGAVVLLSPSGQGDPSSPVRSRYSPTHPYRRLAVSNLVPEIDQIKFGSYLVPAVDPIIDIQSAARLRDLCMRLYRPMEADPAYRALGSAMNYAYDDIDSGHLYEYVPPHAPSERLPVLLFLHGSAGNFKVYFYLFRRFADAHRVILVLPSFGFGNWFNEGGVEAILRARRFAINDLPGDPARVFLAGLSNGGTGASRAAARTPSAFAGLIFLSAVMERAVLGGDAFASGWKGRRVLVVHGETDDRLPQGHALAAVKTMRDAGVDLTVEMVPGEDHFLLFSRPDEVLASIAAFVRK